MYYGSQSHTQHNLLPVAKDKIGHHYSKPKIAPCMQCKQVIMQLGHQLLDTIGTPNEDKVKLYFRNLASSTAASRIYSRPSAYHTIAAYVEPCIINSMDRGGQAGKTDSS